MPYSRKHIPDGPREVVRVGKWPGLPDQRGLTKIPSLVWYSESQQVRVESIDLFTGSNRRSSHRVGNEVWRRSRNIGRSR